MNTHTPNHDKPLAAPGGISATTASKSDMPGGPGSSLSDAEMGAQLTAQYRRAVSCISCMKEVLVFGAMLKQVVLIVSARGHNSANQEAFSAKRGPTAKGGGLKGWLETHAPEVSRPTAYRFLGIYDAVAGEYEQIVGARTAKALPMHKLVTTPAEELPAPMAAKQMELFDFVSGTSQRSWLDQYDTYSPKKGGEREGAGRKSLAAIAADPHLMERERKRRVERLKEGLEKLVWCLEYGVHRTLPEVELDGLMDWLTDILAEVKRWKGLTREDRRAELASGKNWRRS